MEGTIYRHNKSKIISIVNKNESDPLLPMNTKFICDFEF